MLSARAGVRYRFWFRVISEVPQRGRRTIAFDGTEQSAHTSPHDSFGDGGLAPGWPGIASQLTIASVPEAACEFGGSAPLAILARGHSHATTRSAGDAGAGLTARPHTLRPRWKMPCMSTSDFVRVLDAWVSECNQRSITADVIDSIAIEPNVGSNWVRTLDA